MGYFKDVVKSVSWMTLLRFSMRGLAVVKIAILARFLTPEQFGKYGIALLVLGLLEVLMETGINVFMVQEKGKIKPFLDSAWVVSIFRGFFIASIILAASPLIIRFFGASGVSNLLYITAAIALVRGFINPMEIAYQKFLQFKNEFLFRGSLYFVDVVVAVVLGILTRSESALLYGMLAAALTEVFLSFVLFKDKPKLSFEKEKILKVFHHGKWVTGAGIFGYLSQNIDDFLVGRVLGTGNLGYYQQAYNISTLPVSEIGNIFNKVTFPVYVVISEEKERLRKAFVKTVLVISFLVVLFALLVLFFSKFIILVLLGENWLPIEPVLKILAIFGVFKSILNFSYSLFLSLKLQKYVMYSEMAGVLGMVIVIYPMISRFGLVGAGLSAIISFLCSLPVVIYGLRKIFK